jgi:class 3 adenylate cyclase
MVICSGATGSGKSTALHSLLRDVMTPAERVMVVEDRVHVHIEGAVQGFITDDFTISDAMSAMHSSDVDIAVVDEVTAGGELRQLFDLAGQGRLIFTTLSAADAAAALEELLAFRTVTPARIAETVRVITAQRLVRRSCEHCRSLRVPTRDEVDLLGLQGAAAATELVTNAGCDQCADITMLGRAVAVEILTMTPALAAALLRGARDAASFREVLGPEYRTIVDSIRVQLLEHTISIETAIEHLGREHELGAALDALVESVASDRPELGVPSLDGTVAIVFTDIVASTARTAEVGDSVWMEALRHHQALVRKELEVWGGVEVKSTGDGFMLAFASSMSAVRCALAIRDSAPSVLARDGEPLGVKIGVHAGEPIRDGDDFYGTTVNIAARVAAAASSGEVVVSDLVRNLISTDKGFAFSPPRVVEMKGLDEPQPVYVVETI